MKGNGRGGLEGPYDPIRPGKHSEQIESVLWKHIWGYVFIIPVKCFIFKENPI